MKKQKTCKASSTTRRVDNYEKLSEIDHILCRPDMYVGSNMAEQREEYVARLVLARDSIGTYSGQGESDEPIVAGEVQQSVEPKKYHIFKKQVTYPTGLLRIFIEILSNAIDNVSRSRKENIKVTKIKVSINKETGETSIWNDGKVIPIEKNDDGEYIHTMIFGQLRTSSNYNDEEERVTSGRNGMGGKVCCVFSKSFTVTGGDPEVKKQISQTWTNNMKEVEDPVITPYKNVNGFTCVTYVPDFEKFGMTGYTDDIIDLYNKFVIDAAMLTKVNVYLNDENLCIKTLVDYAKLYSSIPSSELLLVKDEKVGEAVIMARTDKITIGDKDNIISFVNGIQTANGGKHVDAFSEEFFRPIVTKFNAKKDRAQINIKDVKQFFHLFVNATIPNPMFESQNKTQLVAPAVKVSVPETIINKILKWDVIDQINAIIQSKEMVVLKKTETKKGNFKRIEGVDHANKAGTKASSECSLILCEGDSAKTFAVGGIDLPLFDKRGRDWFGIFKLRGKIMNPKNHTTKQIAENQILSNLIKALNLRVNVDYTIEENFQTLNYGRVIILVDQDHDGFHIGGLILNFFHTLYPSLMRRTSPPFLVSMMTPIAKVFLKSGEKVSFYDQRKYDTYMQQESVQHTIKQVKYYKGLGSSADDEVLEAYGKKVIEFHMDEQADETIDKIFKRNNTHQRKEWMKEYDPNTYLSIPDHEQISKVSVSDYMNNEVIKFSIDDCARNIPSIMDGLKEGQRKVLYSCFKKKLTKEMKVAQLAGYVAENSSYHHGEANLFGTIINMATCYVGSNNIPLLYRGGQFGTRLMGGDDAAAARYICTRLETLTRYIFPEVDDMLLTNRIEDGIQIEPVFYCPVIPMVLVNGVSGSIGTGWSSSIPCFNPLDLCTYLENWLKQVPPIQLTPWYRNFKGTIERDASHASRYVTTGIYKKVNNKVTISELPVGVWTDNFKEKLEDLVDQKIIKDLKNYSDIEKVHFEFSDMEGQNSEEQLKLHSYLSMTNMVLFSLDGHIKKYDSVSDVIHEFAEKRLDMYSKRKDKLIQVIETKLEKEKLSKRFLEDVMENRLVVFKRKEDDILKDMLSLGYKHVGTTTLAQAQEQEQEQEQENDNPFSFLLRMPVRNFSYEKISALSKTIQDLEKEKESIEKLKPADMWLNDLDKFKKAYSEWIRWMDAEACRLDKLRKGVNSHQDGSKKRKK